MRTASENGRRAVVVFVAVILVVAIGYSVYSLLPKSPTPVQTTQSTQSAFSSTSTDVNYGCTSSGQPTSVSESETSPSNVTSVIVDVNTTEGSTVLNMTMSPTAWFGSVVCGYEYLQTTYPVDCGAACGYGPGYLTDQQYLLSLNFTVSSPINPTGYNLTISTGEGQFSNLMPITSDAVTIDSVPTLWYSTPSCPGGAASASDCLSPVASSITIQLPPIENGLYEVMLNSSESSM